MIPSIPLALLTGLFTGLLFAWAARGPFHDGRTPWGDEVRAVASFGLLIRWPLLVYFFLWHREWSFLYLVPREHLPSALLLLVLPLDAAALGGGYLSGWSLLRRRQRGTLALLLASAGVALVLFLIGLSDRLVHDGDVASFAHLPHPSVEGRLVAILAVTLLGPTVATAFVYRTLAASGGRRREGSVPGSASAAAGARGPARGTPG